ncbi:MAG: carboxylesterase family protein [Deltaproteobacteria bacterium]|nr:carboxylesterase family protein [Deltaproteobacteria bacterium]
MDPSSLRETRGGAVLGFSNELGAHVWRGIPFAKPPSGPLRWRAPRPPEPWQGTRQALAFGATCVQFAGPMSGDPRADGSEPAGSEDCLYLNIFAPRFEPGAVPRAGARLPVLFWIHGGGNTVGRADPYDGSLLALGEEVIVVTLNYRLGVFGWFAHPALRSAEGGGTSVDDRSGNYGTLDLVRGLEWVRENISAFGGDPERVTIFGESAGGLNVYSLLLSPRARGLFQRAISQSGGTWTSTVAEGENPAADPDAPGDAFSSSEVVAELMVRDGSASDRAAARALAEQWGHAKLARYLRDKPAGEVLGVYEGSGLGGMYRAPRLFRDGAVLPAEEPLEVFRSGRHNQVPAILGTNRDENKTFALFSSEHVAHVFALPVWLKDERRYELETSYPSLMWKAGGVDEPAAAMRASQGPSVFAYRFDWDEQPSLLWLDFSRLVGAAHGLEIPFVFGGLDLGPANRFLWDEERRPAAEELSRAIMSYWSQFAYTGDPLGGRQGNLPRWHPWNESSEGSGKFLVLDTQAGGGLRMSNDSVTRKGVIAQVARDDRFESWAERCAIYADFVRWSGRMTEAEYASVADGACAAFPFVE